MIQKCEKCQGHAHVEAPKQNAKVSSPVTADVYAPFGGQTVEQFRRARSAMVSAESEPMPCPYCQRMLGPGKLCPCLGQEPGNYARQAASCACNGRRW